MDNARQKVVINGDWRDWGGDRTALLTFASCVHAGSYGWRVDVAPNPTAAAIAEYRRMVCRAERIVCLGGGSVIDAGKHVAGKRELVAVPCNFSGAEATGYASFYCQGRKHSATTGHPTTVVLNAKYLRGAPPEALSRSWCDAYCHVWESHRNPASTPESAELCALAFAALSTLGYGLNTLWGAHLAGRAIDIAPTGLPHALSYPMVGRYGMHHGDALARVLWRVAEYNHDGARHVAEACQWHGLDISWPDSVDVDVVLDDALANPRAHNNPQPLHREELRKCLTQS